MAHKLTDITTSFHSFAKEQVLTETQLNEFLDYFDEQDRLSRICLSGVGIVCGFDLSVNKKKSLSKKRAATSTSIRITQGAGVTTDGDLIHLVEKIEEKDKPDRNVLTKSIDYTHYRTYEGENVDYHPHFNREDSNSKFKMIPLIEIVSKGNVRKTDEPIAELDLKNKVALFYLEAYPLEPDNCVTINCENQGIEQVNRLRVLLVDIKYIDRITKPDSLYNSYSKLESYLDSRPVSIPRVILTEKNTSTITRLAKQYQEDPLVIESRLNLKSGVEVILQALGRKRDMKDFSRNFDLIFPEKEALKLISFQYKYDLLKDLVDSYNELKGLFLDNYKSCCPDISAFPKHLLLGRVLPDSQLLTDSKSIIRHDELRWRHRFHKSPILLNPEDSNGHFESVLQRILDLVTHANLSTLETFKKELITITPSNVRVPLGRRAIPFYYNFSQSLIQNWDYDKRKFGRFKSTLGYRLAEENTTEPTISDPLRYSLDPYNFYRIEGHQGYSFREAFTTLTELKNAYSLPFDIKVLGIGVEDFEDIIEEQYKCDFKDLAVLLSAWSSEQICVAKEVTDVFTNFSSLNPGENLAEARFFKIRPNLSKTLYHERYKKNDPTFELELTPKEELLGNFNDFSESETDYNKTNISEDLDLIRDSISKEEHSLGLFVDQSRVYAGGSPGNAMAHMLNSLQSVTDGIDDRVAQGTITLPAQISLVCANLVHLIPTSISTLTESTLDDYKIQLNLLCSYSKQLQVVYGDGGLTNKVSVKTQSIVFLLINQLATICCSAKKLQALLEEVDRRKTEIVKRLDFSNFVDKNPGLEHKAGVGPGQTFVLVYLNKSIKKKASINAPVAFRYYQGAAQTLIRKGTVIADFMLPYLCCSDCAPISFVLPDIPVSLSISADGYCIDDDLQLDLTVVPEDGIVTVVDSVPGVIIEDGKLRIDGTIFPTELLGTAIKFKVDGENTDAELIVSKTPTISITPPDPGSNRIVNFTVVGDDFPVLIYAWDFGNGETSSDREPTHDFTESASSSSPERVTYNVTLTVTSVGGICPAVISHEITFETVDVKVTLPQTIFCQGDSNEYSFIFTPDNIGGITVTGQGVSESDSTFSPGELAPDEYTLLASNGEELKVTVVEEPTISIKEIEATENGFKTSITLPEGVSDSTITWTFVDNTTTNSFTLREPILGTTDIDINFADFLSESWTEVKITMTIDVPPCGLIEDVVFYPKPVSVIVELPQYTFCQDDKKNYDFIFVPDQPMVMTGNGVNATANHLFSPGGLELGTHTLSAANGYEFDVTIVEPGTGTLNEAVLNEVDREVTLKYTPDGGGANLVGLKWSIGKKVIGDLGDLTSPTSETYVVSLEEWGLRPGDTLLYRVTLATEFCGDRIENDSFLIPDDKLSCNDQMVLDLTTIHTNRPTRSELQLFVANYNKVGTILEFYDFIADLITRPIEILNGSLNNEITAKLKNFIEFLGLEIVPAIENADLLNQLLKLYRMAVGVYANAFRCQDVSFTSFKGGILLNDLLRRHFDNKTQTSLISRGFIIFNSTNSVPFFTILDSKDKTKEPWSTINFVIRAKINKA